LKQIKGGVKGIALMYKKKMGEWKLGDIRTGSEKNGCPLCLRMMMLNLQHKMFRNEHVEKIICMVQHKSGFSI
jgi:hypothetical protein